MKLETLVPGVCITEVLQLSFAGPKPGAFPGYQFIRRDHGRTPQNGQAHDETFDSRTHYHCLQPAKQIAVLWHSNNTFAQYNAINLTEFTSNKAGGCLPGELAFQEGATNPWGFGLLSKLADAGCQFSAFRVCTSPRTRC